MKKYNFDELMKKMQEASKTVTYVADALCTLLILFQKIKDILL